MIILLYELIRAEEDDSEETGEIIGISCEPVRFRINYFQSLQKTLEYFNRDREMRGEYLISKFYNKYGQEIPLNYNVQKNFLDVYFLKDDQENKEN